MIEQAIAEIKRFACRVAERMGKLTERITITVSLSLKNQWDSLPDEIKQETYKDIRAIIVLAVDRHRVDERIDDYVRD